MQWPWPASPVRTRHALLLRAALITQSCAASACARLKLSWRHGMLIHVTISWRKTQEILCTADNVTKLQHNATQISYVAMKKVPESP